MTRENEAHRAQVKDLKLNLELLESQQEKKESDYAVMLSKQAQEIQELHKLLSKSYNSASSSLEKVKLASRLESETKELAKKVKDVSAMRALRESRAPPGAPIRGSVEVSKNSDENRNKSPLSLSQLTTTPPTANIHKGK